MTKVHLNAFDPVAFLAKAGIGRMIVQLKGKEDFFAQGDKADCVFYIQKGRAKLTVISTVQIGTLVATE
jgi:CRP/FNR family transcriptional regulator, cyclic AMP receptor protein